jgi:hypothetical protein
MHAGFRRSVAAGVVAAALLGACGEAPAPVDRTAAPTIAARPSLSRGDPAPEFSLPGTDGKQYSLASYRGRQAVVLAWFAKAFTEG